MHGRLLHLVSVMEKNSTLQTIQTQNPIRIGSEFFGDKLLGQQSSSGLNPILLGWVAPCPCMEIQFPMIHDMLQCELKKTKLIMKLMYVDVSSLSPFQSHAHSRLYKA